MSTTPRLQAPGGAVPDTLGDLLVHVPEIAQTFGAMYAQLWQHGRIGADLREMTRLRNARITDCGY
ncbi:MAG: hypothetical protein AAF515_10070 [Pseudomonadota bacterium]